MDKHDNFVLGLILFFGVLTVMLFSATAEADIHGQAGKGVMGKGVINKPVTCVETDDGINHYAKGTTYMSNNKNSYVTDYCRNYDSNILVEYYCDNGKIKSQDHYCPDGCSNGVCIRIPLDICGDGVVSGTEQCDIGHDGSYIDALQCKDLYPNIYVEGVLSCNPPGYINECMWNTDYCISNAGYCGDGIKNGLEQCDGSDLNGLTCLDFGFDGGTLSCMPRGSQNECLFNMAYCILRTT